MQKCDLLVRLQEPLTQIIRVKVGINLLVGLIDLYHQINLNIVKNN